MHEVSLAGGILRMVEEVAARDGFKRLSALRLEAGVLASVDVRALRFALEAIAPGSVLEGAQLVIEQPEGQAFCFGCGQNVQIAARGDACPLCGAYRLHPTSGTELRVLELTVHDV
jgi:hydrogenase nickel incorporation protein HypA/HybF